MTATAYCEQCGAPMPATARFCHTCGAEQSEVAPLPDRRPPEQPPEDDHTRVSSSYDRPDDSPTAVRPAMPRPEDDPTTVRPSQPSLWAQHPVAPPPPAAQPPTAAPPPPAAAPPPPAAQPPGAAPPAVPPPPPLGTQPPGAAPPAVPPPPPLGAQPLAVPPPPSAAQPPAAQPPAASPPPAAAGPPVPAAQPPAAPSPPAAPQPPLATTVEGVAPQMPSAQPPAGAYPPPTAQPPAGEPPTIDYRPPSAPATPHAANYPPPSPASAPPPADYAPPSPPGAPPLADYPPPHADYPPPPPPPAGGPSPAGGGAANPLPIIAGLPLELWAVIVALVGPAIWLAIDVIKAIPDAIKFLGSQYLGFRLGLASLLLLLLVGMIAAASLFVAWKLYRRDRVARGLAYAFSGTVVLSVLLADDRIHSETWAAILSVIGIAILAFAPRVRAEFAASGPAATPTSVIVSRTLIVVFIAIAAAVALIYLLLYSVHTKYVVAGIVLGAAAVLAERMSGRLDRADKEARLYLSIGGAVVAVLLLALGFRDVGLLLPIGLIASAVGFIWLPNDARAFFGEAPINWPKP